VIPDGYWLLDAKLGSGAAFLAHVVKVSLIKLIDSWDRPARRPSGGRSMHAQSFMHPVDGIDWYCQQQRDGPAVVLVPSGEGDCTPFDPVVARLADEFSVLTFDMPGFSRTGDP
jgi:pimeloyl-ACP methyl ester carboxylesterase